MSVPTRRKGRLLVATPSLTDPNFHRTVVFVLEHNDDGAVGVVLNRPTDLDAHENLPADYTGCIALGEPIYEGGPVEPESVILLADFVEPPADSELAVETIGVVDPSTDFASLPGNVRALRAFGGYAGWAPGQLEAELDEDAWIDATGTAADVFTTDPDGLWSAVLDRKGGNYRLVARMPLDPSLN